jgi:hypothetical protein
MVEIGVMVRQMPRPRIMEMSTLIAEVAKWEQRRNRDEARIEWLFVDRAREKLGRVYPTPSPTKPRRHVKAAA